MTHAQADVAPVRYARLAGLGYIGIIVAGIFGEFVVRSSLFLPGDPAATAARITAADTLFRAGLAAEVVMVMCDVLVGLALYMVFRPVSPALALLAAFFRLAHAAVVAANLLNGYLPLIVLGGGGATLGTDHAQALALVFLEAHAFGYAIGLAFFGAHCLVLGVLAFRSGFVPRALAALLLVAGAAYLLDTFARTLWAGYPTYAATVTALLFGPAFVAEVAFTVWLLRRPPAPPRPSLAPERA